MKKTPIDNMGQTIRIVLLVALFCLFTNLSAEARSVVYDPQVKTLQMIVNDDWMSLPVMQLGSDDVLNVSFDELSHTYHRYLYRVERCEADWTPSEGLFESDWLSGFSENPIEDYENSLNTTVLYTHYQLQIPNERCQLKMSGNYRLHIVDDEDDHEVLCAEFMVVERLMDVGLGVTTNTDVDVNVSHQQVAMTVNYRSLNVSNPDLQLHTVVMQNGREDTRRLNPKPTFKRHDQMKWEHCRELIFDAGNEYHKFEMLDLSHATMGVDHIVWDGKAYHVFPFVQAPRRNYLYDEDADGAFLIRNSDNYDIERTCDYAWVHFTLSPSEAYADEVVADGRWATAEDAANYQLDYNADTGGYSGAVLLKQGYYNYQFMLRDATGTLRPMPEEGSFFETQNSYQAMVYYREITGRTWRLVGYQQVILK